MKKILLGLLCSWSAALYGQETVTYDVKTGKFSNLPPIIKEGSTISIRYTNVNPFSLSSNASFADINHSYQDGLTNLQAGLSSVTAAKTSAATEKTAAEASERLVVKEKRANGIVKPHDVQTSESVQYFVDKLSLLHDIQGYLGNIQSDITSLNSILALDGLIKGAAVSPLLYTKALMTNALLGPLAGVGVTAAADISTQSNAKISDIQSNLNLISGSVSDLANIAVRLKDNDPEKKQINDLVADFKKTVADLQAIYAGANLAILLNNFAVLRQNADLMMNADFELSPVSVGTAAGDFIELKDELKDKTGKVVVAIAPHRIKTYHGSRVDFSVGVGMNIGGNGSEYALRKNPDNLTTSPGMDRVSLYKSGKNTLLQLDPVILVHWYQTTKHTVQWMLTGGIGPDFSSMANTKIYLGTSLGFPSSNDLTKRLVVNFGVAVGFADVLKTEYRDWNDYARFATVNNADLTSKSIRVGAFFAFTYNIGGTNH